MKIITSTCVFPSSIDPLESVPRLANVGFDGVDIDFDCRFAHGHLDRADQHLDWAKRVRDLVRQHNMQMVHSHAPGDVTHCAALEQVLQCCQIMGIRYTVLHPTGQRADLSIIEDAQEFLDVNIRVMRPILELAEKYQVVILSENLCWGGTIPLKNISDLVDAVHSPWFGWCCDTGHIHGFGTGIRELEEVSRVPQMLHIQDNNGDNRDDHMIPFDGSIDWYECMRILKKMDYQGEFTLEAHHKCRELPDEMRDSHLTELLMRSRKLAAYYDGL